MLNMMAIIMWLVVHFTFTIVDEQLGRLEAASLPGRQQKIQDCLQYWAEPATPGKVERIGSQPTDCKKLGNEEAQKKSPLGKIQAGSDRLLEALWGSAWDLLGLVSTAPGAIGDIANGFFDLFTFGYGFMNADHAPLPVQWIVYLLRMIATMMQLWTAFRMMSMLRQMIPFLR